tara:strand:- start:2560 stop:3585 length:1026 start_codon:yes stop_codon:yes gene_type:complete
MKTKFILNKSILKKQLDKIQKVADEISYSLKTNYEVGKILEETSNCSFSVHSLEALNLINDKKRIYYFSQGWNFNELNELFNKKIKSFVVDNQKDLDLLLKFLEDKKEKINLLIRMRLKENTIQTGKHFVFGFYSSEINKLIPKLKNNKYIEKVGIHFHRKTQNISEWSLKKELEDSLDESTFEMIDIINIGGGLPSVYKNYNENIIESIFDRIKELKDWLNKKEIKVIIEPGRAIAAPAVKLVTYIKNIYDNNIIVDCSVYNTAMDTFIANIRLLVENEENAGSSYTIKGCTPDSIDIFRYKVFLNNPQIGDKLTFLNAGAYNFNTDFCKLPKIETEVME